MTPPIFLALYVGGFLFAAALRLWYGQEFRRRLNMTGWRPVLDTWLVYLPAAGIFLVPAVYILTPVLAFADYSLPGWAGYAGAIILAGAILLLWRAHLDLGANFTPYASVQQGQILVTSGVYRYIRHPMYAAHLIWALAQPLLLWNWIAGFSLLATFVPLYLVRVPVEERLLAGKFGREYVEYMARTGRIIPRFSRNETEP